MIHSILIPALMFFASIPTSNVAEQTRRCDSDYLSYGTITVWEIRQNPDSETGINGISSQTCDHTGLVDLRSCISAYAGLIKDDVVLINFGFQVQIGSTLEAGERAIAVNGRQYMFSALSSNGATYDANVCLHDSKHGKTEVISASGVELGKAFLIGTTIDGRNIVFASSYDSMPASDFEDRGVGMQRAFSDSARSLQVEAGLDFTVEPVAVDCKYEEQLVQR